MGSGDRSLVDLVCFVLHTPDVRFALLLMLCALLVAPAAAHESASARLDALTLEVALSPRDAQALLARADEHRRLGSLDAAATDLRAAAGLGADAESLALQRALLALANENHHRATLLLAPHRESLSPALHDARADASEPGDPAEACAARLAALERGPDTPRALAAERVCVPTSLRGLLDGLATAEDVLGFVPQLRSARIRTAIAAGHTSQAVSLSDELVLRSPNSPAALLLRAAAHSASDPSRATTDRRAALALAERRLSQRGTPLHRLARAEALLALGHHAEARTEVERVLATAPDLASARTLARRLGSQ